MDNSLKLLWVIITFNACVAAQSLSKGKDCLDYVEIKSFLKSETKHIKGKGKVFSVKIINYLPDNPDGLAHLLNSKVLTYFEEINTISTKTDFTKIFSHRDFEFMKCQLKQNQFKKWSKLGEKNYFEKYGSIDKVKNTNIYNSQTYLETLRDAQKYLYYSIPLFSIDKKHALLYRETNSSGTLYILKKVKDKWRYIAQNLIWVE